MLDHLVIAKNRLERNAWAEVDEKVCSWNEYIFKKYEDRSDKVNEQVLVTIAAPPYVHRQQIYI